MVHNGSVYYATAPNNWAFLTHQATVSKIVRDTNSSARLANIKFGKLIPPNGGYRSASELKLSLGFADLANALNYLLESNRGRSLKISAIVLSLGQKGVNTLQTMGCSSTLRPIIEKLYAQGIAVVVATGNDFVKNKVSDPACITKAISVGAINSNDQVYAKSNSAAGLDFVALGDATDAIFSGIKYEGYTSWAAPRVAAYIARLRTENSSVSLDRILEVMHATGKPITDKNGVVATKVNINTALTQINESPSTDPTPPPPTTGFEPVPMIDSRLFSYGELNQGQYGKGYGSNVHASGYGMKVMLNDIISPTNALVALEFSKSTTDALVTANASCGATYRLSYNLFDNDKIFSSHNEIALYLNNQFMQYLPVTPNNALRAQSVDICGSQLKAGENLFEFRVHNNSLDAWGVTNIKLEFADADPITLLLDKINTSGYGYGFGSNKHHLSLLINFTKPTNGSDVRFSLNGWDIDSPIETSVYINDNLIGLLTNACSSCYNGGDAFVFTSDQMRAGNNQIVLRQRAVGPDWSGFQDEKWGVKDLLVKEKGVNIVPILQLLLLDD